MDMEGMRRRIQEAAKTYGKSGSPRLSVLADYINRAFPELEAEVEATEYNTDRHPKGVMWRIPGKGRKGNKLTVYRRADDYMTRITSNPVFRHNAAETYRHNYEVCAWVVKYERERTATV
jgi:hypothetical protein